MINFIRFSILMFLVLPMMCAAQEEYKSEVAGFSIKFPKKPYEKVGTNSTEVIYEDSESGLVYIASFKPTSQQKMSGDELVAYAKAKLTEDAPNSITSIKANMVSGEESVRITMMADYQQYQIYYRLDYLVINGFELSFVLMSSEDNISFEALNSFESSLKFVK